MLNAFVYTSLADPYCMRRWVKPSLSNASRDEGLRTDSISAVNGAVAPVVTKHSFAFGVHFQAVAILNQSVAKQTASSLFSLNFDTSVSVQVHMDAWRGRAEVGQQAPRIGSWHGRSFPPPSNGPRVLLSEKFTRPSSIPSSMASVTRRLLLQSRRCPSSSSSFRSTPKYTWQWQRPLSTTPSRRARADREDGEAREPEAPAKIVEEATWANTPNKTAAQLQKLAEDLKALDPEIVDDAVRKGKQGIPFAKEFELDKDEDFDIVEDDQFRVKAGFWAEGEESMGPDEDYYGDDITSHGHGELQKHRELREYARLIAWELPLLSRTSTRLQALAFPTQILIPPRPCPPLRTPYLVDPLSLPLHLVPRRITPCREQGGGGILAL